MVEQYSNRQLTNPNDSLNAILGIVNNIRQSRPYIFTLCGLPFSRLYDNRPAIDRGTTVSAALAWSLGSPLFGSDHGATSTRTRHRTFPSWTWAGWQGHVRFMNNMEGKVVFRSLVTQPKLYETAGEGRSRRLG